MENKKCSKPPSSLRLQPTTLLQKDLTHPDAICTDAESQPQIAAKTYAASIGQGVNF
jgi:hypothetical protein